MDFFDLADTALKIGLGAAVSGIATFKVAKLNHDRDIEKQALIRRLDALEKASVAFQQYAHSWRLWCGCLSGILKGSNPPVGAFSLQQAERMREVDDGYQRTRENLLVGSAGLHLMGAEDALNALKDIVNGISVFRDRVTFRREVPTIDEHEAFMKEVAQQKKVFERALSVLYMQTR